MRIRSLKRSGHNQVGSWCRILESLHIIGLTPLTVFNYDFCSVTRSPMSLSFLFYFWVYSPPSLYTKLIHSSISLLHQMRFMKFFFEAEHPSTFYFLYYNLEVFSSQMDRSEAMVKFQCSVLILLFSQAGNRCWETSAKWLL